MIPSLNSENSKGHWVCPGNYHQGHRRPSQRTEPQWIWIQPDSPRRRPREDWTTDYVSVVENLDIWEGIVRMERKGEEGPPQTNLGRGQIGSRLLREQPLHPRRQHSSRTRANQPQLPRIFRRTRWGWCPPSSLTQGTTR